MKNFFVKIKICILILLGNRCIVSIDVKGRKDYEVYLMGATIWQCMKTSSALQDYSHSKITEQ
jgi:hypothetical protein